MNLVSALTARDFQKLINLNYTRELATTFVKAYKLNAGLTKIIHNNPLFLSNSNATELYTLHGAVKKAYFYFSHALQTELSLYRIVEQLGKDPSSADQDYVVSYFEMKTSSPEIPLQELYTLGDLAQQARVKLDNSCHNYCIYRKAGLGVGMLNPMASDIPDLSLNSREWFSGLQDREYNSLLALEKTVLYTRQCFQLQQNYVF